MKWMVQPHGHVLSLRHLWYSMAGTCLTLRVPEQSLGINFLLLIIHWVFNHEPFISWKDLQIAYPRSVMWNSPRVIWCICGWTRSQILNPGPPSQCSSWNIRYFYKIIFKVRHSVSAQSFSLLSFCHRHPGYYNSICIYSNIITCINNSSTFPLGCVLLWGAHSSFLTCPLTRTYWTSFILFGLKTQLAAHEAWGNSLDPGTVTLMRHSLCSGQESKKEATTSSQVCTEAWRCLKMSCF